MNTFLNTSICSIHSDSQQKPIYINNCPTRCNTKQSIYYCASLLYVFWYFADRASQYIYLNINQLDALNFVSLFHASTYFEHMCSSSGGQNLYYAASGIITLVGGRPVHRLREDCARDGHLQVWWYQMLYSTNFDLLTMSTCARNM